MKKHYLPAAEEARVTWLNTFSAKFNDLAVSLGFTEDDAKKVADMAALYAYIIGLIAKANTFAKQLTAFKNILSFAPSGATLGDLPDLNFGTAPVLTDAGIFTYIAGLVKQIKGQTGVYNEAMGEELGIIGEDSTFEQDDYQTTLTGKSLPESVKITFTKHGVDGVNIYSHAVGGDEAVWVKLGFDGHSPYHDTRPLAVAGKPETRKYKARGVINDTEIGQYSDELSVTFTD